MSSLIKYLSGLVIALLLLVAVLLGAWWAPDQPPEALAERWAQPPSSFVTIDGMPVHYRDQGSRDAEQTVLLLHGTSASLHTWEGWVAEMGDAYRVVSLDLPGFGLTGPFVSHDDYSIGAYTTFMGQAMDALEIEQAVVAGNSFGGEVAWETALAMPERVSALILVDAAGYPIESVSMPLGFRIAQTPALSSIMNRVLPRSVIESSVRNVYGDPSLVTDELVDRYYDLTLREGNRAALSARFTHAVWRDESGERLATLTQPTLVIWGAQDRLIPPENGHRFVQDMPNAELVMFETLGHVPQEEDPQATAQAALSFLEQAFPEELRE
ncbi:MAG: alpha/beta fold hydrolase [Alcanivorax sp.]|nr:alpha/beta fold hydrolase [Alcanivorax sp.]